MLFRSHLSDIWVPQNFYMHSKVAVQLRRFVHGGRIEARATQLALVVFADVQLLGAATGVYGPFDGHEVLLILFYTVAGLLTIDALFASDAA